MPVRRSNVRAGHARRKLVWATTDQSVNIPAGQISNTNLLAILAVAGSSLLGVTVMRTHVRIEMTSIAGQATTDQYRIGLIIGRNTDVGVNIAGQQDPANPELDWMHIDRVIPTASGATVDSTQHWVIDNHSKRKMQELNQAYLLCLQQNAAAARTFNLYCRTLIALP